MYKLPEIERTRPLGLTPEELQECSEDAEEDPPNIPWPVSMGLAIERMLVRKGQKPDAWTNMLADQYSHLIQHSDNLADALAVLLDRCAQYGVEHRDCAAVLEDYLACTKRIQA